ncbi:hypothetical protein M527_06535 [Sphingobium indicum IP26]|uniref:AAA family ATPase n=1 Tax=Sphingobium indicum F2 TaxID=1450518 RepID=A0A8E0WTS3_9SPHN|nr:ATP-binding protein [Sphingobium indicum]EPR09780.1 hypothetical protein M527_06535 [Sphingobium indicum IP26]KER37270.1 hypothetical protein AL00_06250 [Sphingobium indicum F2]
MKIISADERLANKAGIKGIILGPAGIGKTSLLHTLDPATTLFVNAEAGELSVQDWPGDMVKLRTWTEARNLAAIVGGANPAYGDDAVYGPGHFQAATEAFGEGALDKYKTVFIDSITEVSRLCFTWCRVQPEAFSEKTGKPDTRGAYGLLGREMVEWLKQFQHAPKRNVWLVGLLNEVKDDFGRIQHVMQIEGSKTALEAPGITDQVISMVQMQTEEGASYRAFVAQAVNPWSYPAKDRSGRLEMIEEPHLGRLMEKISGPKKPASERLSFHTPTPDAGTPEQAMAA